VVHCELASYIPGRFQLNATHAIAGVDVSNPPDEDVIDYDAREVCPCKWSDVSSCTRDLSDDEFDSVFKMHLLLEKKKPSSAAASGAKPRTPKKQAASAAVASAVKSRTPKKKVAAAAAAAESDNNNTETSSFPIPTDLATVLLSRIVDAEFDLKIVYCPKGKSFSISVDHSPNTKKAELGTEPFTADLTCKRKKEETVNPRPKKKSKAEPSSSSSSSSSAAAAAVE